jgi:nitrate/nitrite transporter NarK
MNFCGNMVGVIVPILIGLIVQFTGSYFLALIFFVVMAFGLMLFSSSSTTASAVWPEPFTEVTVDATHN